MAYWNCIDSANNGEVLHRYPILWPILNPRADAGSVRIQDRTEIFMEMLDFISIISWQCRKSYRLRLATQFWTISTATDTKRCECVGRLRDSWRLFVRNDSDFTHARSGPRWVFGHRWPITITDTYLSIPPSGSYYALVGHLVHWICPHPAYEMLMMRAHRCRWDFSGAWIAVHAWCWRCLNLHHNNT